jgi:hypothetical protein
VGGRPVRAAPRTPYRVPTYAPDRSEPESIGIDIPDAKRLLMRIQARGPRGTIHGIGHWLRVVRNGLELLTPKTDAIVVLLFGLMHDSMRRRDGRDPRHGARLAGLARLLNGDRFTLEDGCLEALCQAIEFHDVGGVTSEPTIGHAGSAIALSSPASGSRPTRHCSRPSSAGA